MSHDKVMRVLFMGTPQFACEPFKALINAGHDICAVFTRPDKQQGRGMRLMSPPVKLLAEEYGIKVYQPAKLKDNAEALGIINALNPDIIVVVAYGRILPASILGAAPYGCVNIHASLLPLYRGAAPIQRAVINGERETGITTMYMSEELDAGDIIFQEKIDIGDEDTGGQVHDKLAECSKGVIIRTLEAIQNNEAPRIEQRHEEATYAPMLTKDDAKIDWNKPSYMLHNLIRGMQPWPVAHWNGLKIHSAMMTQERGNGLAGTFLSDGRVICGDLRVLKLLEVQAAGKRRMGIADYLRGHSL